MKSLKQQMIFGEPRKKTVTVEPGRITARWYHYSHNIGCKGNSSLRQKRYDPRIRRLKVLVIKGRYPNSGDQDGFYYLD